MTVGKLDLAALEAKDVFIHRHIGPSAADIAEMLESEDSAAQNWKPDK